LAAIYIFVDITRIIRVAWMICSQPISGMDKQHREQEDYGLLEEKS